MSIEDDRIEQLKRKLYSRNEEPVIDLRTPVKEYDSRTVSEEKNTWGDNTLHIPEDMANNRAHPLLKRFLFGSGLFFLVALAVSAYVFFGGGNFVSSNNVDIKIAGPSTIASGQAVDLSVSLVNQNSSDLEFAKLSIDYPEGTKKSSDSTTPLTHDEQSIGTIAKGSVNEQAISAYFFGDKGVTRSVTFTLTYKLSGSNAVFKKEKSYDIDISSSPVIVQISGPTQINSGQQVSFTGTVTSNSNAVLKNIVLQAEYPYGFTFVSSSLSPVTGKQNVWKLGDIKTGDTKNFTIIGQLSAQDGEERTFQFAVGTQSSDPTQDIDTVLSQATQTIAVRKPFIATNFVLSGSSADTVFTRGGDTVSGDINFTNTLAEPINNLSVVVRITGSTFDRGSARADAGGFYQSTDGTITWDRNSSSKLSQLSQGESQDVSFSFATLRPQVNTKNPVINVALTISGSRQSSDGTVGDVSSTVSRSVKLNANLVFTGKTLRNGPIQNSGPAIPKAEVPSTYTINWALTNTWNDVSGAKVTAVLPSGVTWVGSVSPSTAPVSYDANSRTVTWSPDAVSAGAGYSLSPKEVFFQVKVTPSLSQVGQNIQLMAAPQVTAKDTFTGSTFTLSGTPLTTQPADTNGNGVVTS